MHAGMLRFHLLERLAKPGRINFDGFSLAASFLASSPLLSPWLSKSVKLSN